MKKLLFILTVMFSLNSAAISAQRENSHITGISLNSAKKKEPINRGNGPVKRSIIQTAYAYIYNNVICIDFNEAFPTVTICITNELTGETVYTETHNAPASINISLDEEISGSYLIEIESDDILLYGRFSL